MIIDSHQHVFWHGRDDAGLVADMDAHDIAVAWLLTWEILPAEDEPRYHRALNPAHLRADGTHAGIPLSDLLLARAHYPERFVVGYCPHPLRGSAPEAFEAAHRIHNVRVCGEWKFRLPFDDPRCLELFRKAGELACPVVLHLDVPYLPHAETGKPVYQKSWYGGTVENLERALKACPETVFIGHAPGFWREISGDADRAPQAYPTGPVTPGGRLYDLFERYPNLRADLSAGSALGALKRDPAHAREFLCALADRLLFGRDYYGGDLHTFLKSLELPAEVEEQILCRNAQRLVPLPPGS
jgi:predicted TIM-barrel fold metal-dependent hydrolase